MGQNVCITLRRQTILGNRSDKIKYIYTTDDDNHRVDIDIYRIAVAVVHPENQNKVPLKNNHIIIKIIFYNVRSLVYPIFF